MGCMANKGEEAICSECGFDSSANNNPEGYLAIKSEIAERYIVGTLLENNGEGATYLAWDKNNDVSVRLREFFPDKLATRADDGVTVNVSTDNDQFFGTYRSEFLNLAQSLSESNDLVNLLNVTDIFESNGTAYYVTENVKSITLREFLLRNGGLLTWEQFRPLVTPVVTSLSALHSKGIIHRGISPETLMVGKDGIIRITGFCIPAVRTENSDLTAQLYPGYAAIEQYGFDGKQGAWTDIYGLTATIFRVLVGNPPPEATERVSNDRMIIPAKIVQSMPQNILNTLARGLAILADDRTKNMDKFKANISVQSPAVGSNTVVVPNVGKAAVGSATGNVANGAISNNKEENGKKYAIIAIVLAIIIFLVVLYFIWTAIIAPSLLDKDSTSSKTSSVSSVVSDETSSTLVIEGETTVVPKCVGLKLSEVLSDVETSVTLEFVVIEKNYSDEYERNVIYYQSIEPDTVVAQGTVIEIKISLGPRTITVPNVKTMTIEEAKLTLVAAGFEIGNIKEMSKEDPTVEYGKAIGTSIESGKPASPDSSIIIYWSSSNKPVNSQGGNNNQGGGTSGGTSSGGTSGGGTSGGGTSSGGTSSGGTSSDTSNTTTSGETTSPAGE